MLYRVVDAHLDAFLDAAAHHAEGARLPAFVEQEFRDFLAWGVLARGFCPGCGGRRMTESVARLVDHVLPHVPVRQWVLSLPYRLRYLLAWESRPVPRPARLPTPARPAGPSPRRPIRP